MYLQELRLRDITVSFFRLLVNDFRIFFGCDRGGFVW